MTIILVPYHLDERLIDLDWPAEADHVATVDLPDGGPWVRMAALYDHVAQLVARVPTPTVLSGDCTTSLAVVAGLQRAGIDPAIVWFDAHGDVQTPETTASGYLGGMPLRLLVGHRPELIADALGLAPVAEDRVLLVDARDLDPPEAEYLGTSAIQRCDVGSVTDDRLPRGPLYLHLDVDVVTPSHAAGSAVPGNRWTIVGAGRLRGAPGARHRSGRRHRSRLYLVAGTRCGRPDRAPPAVSSDRSNRANRISRIS